MISQGLLNLFSAASIISLFLIVIIYFLFIKGRGKK